VEFGKVWNSAKCEIWQSVKSTYFELAKVANELVERQNLVVSGSGGRFVRVENVAAVNIQAVIRLPNVCAAAYLASVLVDHILILVEPIFALAEHEINDLAAHNNLLEFGVHKVRAVLDGDGIRPRAMIERFEFRRRLLPAHIGVWVHHFHLGRDCEIGGIAKSTHGNCELQLRIKGSTKGSR
jgi:hypothetical protein